jgi:hypothetical protein
MTNTNYEANFKFNVIHILCNRLTIQYLIQLIANITINNCIL